VKETSFPLSSVNINASDGELWHIKFQNSSAKPRARHSLLKQLNLAPLSELTPQKKEIHGKEAEKVENTMPSSSSVVVSYSFHSNGSLVL
jgi:hypothetical protein